MLDQADISSDSTVTVSVDEDIFLAGKINKNKNEFMAEMWRKIRTPRKSPCTIPSA
jgi:hypothetical protein